ncbi:MAG: hypothetical protein IIC74_06030, partial [Bacteroidetes bacterium]|nr:hypothetical protein [Bacteroidota bacterium]
MLETAWGFLFTILLGIILWGYNSAMKKINIDKKTRLKRLGLILSVASLWLLYVFAVVQSGILSDASMPPKFPLLIIAPLFIFTGIFLFRKRNSTILHAIPSGLPIAYQSFRAVIEVLFYFTFLKGLFPEVATFSGYNYDILLGLSAPVVVYFSYKKANSEKLLIAWNILGLLIVAIAA